MVESRRSKKNRNKSYLFNPYKNGISSYDVAFLSLRTASKSKTAYIQSDSKKDYLAA